jgi:hypothetical protein
VISHELPLLVVQRSLLRDHGRRDEPLAQIVDEGGEPEDLDPAARQAQMPADGGRERGHVRGVVVEQRVALARLVERGLDGVGGDRGDEFPGFGLGSAAMRCGDEWLTHELLAIGRHPFGG